MYKELIIEEDFNALRLPRMKMSEKWDFEFKQVLKTLETAQIFFTVLQDIKGNLQVIHSGLTEEMYALFQTALHRNIEVHDFIKLNLITIEKFRSGKMMEAYEIMTRGVEYIRIKNSKNIHL